jgi:hypothetical protein
MKKDKQPSMDIPKPANLLEWLGDMLKLENFDRAELVDTMLQTYITTCSEENPDELDNLVMYLQNSTQNEEFKKALNNINLGVAMTFIAEDDLQYQQAVRRLLFDSRQDSQYSRNMKLYYLNNLGKDEFSGITFNDEEYKVVKQRMDYLKDEYLKINNLK